jgi:glycosyltransferase involved in cell wall biosynthesis
MSALPLVSIGLPVYNGMPHLRAAIDTLLKQNYPHIELIISDNASEDGTGDFCRALAQIHPHVHYVRNAHNIGPADNFKSVLERARGDYFMWAAHDDKWSEHYVSALVESLSAKPAAVLATPTVIHLREDGTLSNEPPDRPAPGKSELDNLRVLYEDHAPTWIYGLWQTAWLKTHMKEYYQYPFWGADVMWLADICLRCDVVGNQEAVIFKRWRKSNLAPATARAAVAFWIAMFWNLTRISIRRTEGTERLRTLGLSWRYVYRLCIRRPHILRTAWRVVRMVSLAAITSIPAGLAYLWRRATRPAVPLSGRVA